MTYIIQGHFKFWKDYQNFLSEVASDLNVDLNIIEIDPINRYEALRAMESIVSSNEKPDFVVFAYSYEVGPQMLKLANDANIYSFIYNTDIPEKNRTEIGMPREKLKYWIGHRYPDDQKVGYLLADTLIKQRRQKSHKEDVDIIAVSGFSRSTVSEYRKEGLHERSNNDNKVKVKRVIYTNWETENAKDGVQKLLQFYPEASVIWNASDSLALGALQAAIYEKKKPGRDVFIGGVDWRVPAIKEIIAGNLSASLGGHFMGGGWSLVLLHDFYHSIDFKDELGSTINYPLELITKKNAQEYLDVFGNDKWKQIDFKKFSKYYNKSLKKYDFSLDVLLGKSH